MVRYKKEKLLVSQQCVKSEKSTDNLDNYYLSFFVHKIAFVLSNPCILSYGTGIFLSSNILFSRNIHFDEKGENTRKP